MILPVLNKVANLHDYILCYKVRISAIEPMDVVDVFIDANTNQVITKKQISISCYLNNNQGNKNITILACDDENIDVDVADCSTGGCQQGTASLHKYGWQYIYTDKFKYGTFNTCTYRTKDNCTGTTLYTRKYAYPGPNIVDIRDNSNLWNTSGDDQDGTTAHWSLERTHDYFRYRYGRNSWNGLYSQLSLYTNKNAGSLNASFTGNSIVLTKKLTAPHPCIFLDVIGHEFTHGITQTTSYLTYQGESGTLNEGFSDIFGTMVEFYGNNNWNTGQSGNYTINELSTTWRDMSNPNSYSNPDTYSGTHWANPNDAYDYGGVHINSGILNYWFYLVAEGGTGVNDNNNQFCVQSIGKEKASDIAWRTLTSKLYPSANFSNCMFLSIQSAIELYGANSNEVAQVTATWYAVGVGTQYAGTIDVKNMTFNSPQNFQYNSKITVQNVSSNPSAGLIITSNTEIELLPEINFNSGSENQLYIAPSCAGGARMANPNNGGNSTSNQSITNEDVLARKVKNETVQAFYDLNVFPNPSNGNFTFTLTLNNNSELPKAIVVRDILGRVIINITNPTEYVHNLNIESSSSGIFIINVFYSENTVSKRLIKN